MDIGLPSPTRLDLVALGDFVAELGLDVAVEAEVGSFVEEGGAVRVGWNVAVEMLKSGSGRAGERLGVGGEGTGERLADGEEDWATGRMHGAGNRTERRIQVWYEAALRS